jgi:hypothetical protein
MLSQRALIAVVIIVALAIAAGIYYYHTRKDKSVAAWGDLPLNMSIRRHLHGSDLEFHGRATPQRGPHHKNPNWHAQTHPSGGLPVQTYKRGER